ncbi:MAG: preprotein translocase subunit SecG [Malacoplasma sp.]
MEWLDILFYVLAIISLIVALLLSGHGSTGGLSSVSGNELEIFKKTKDRGLIKILQLILFILVFILIGIGIVIRLVVYK